MTEGDQGDDEAKHAQRRKCQGFLCHEDVVNVLRGVSILDKYSEVGLMMTQAVLNTLTVSGCGRLNSCKRREGKITYVWGSFRGQDTASEWWRTEGTSVVRQNSIRHSLVVETAEQYPKRRKSTYDSSSDM